MNLKCLTLVVFGIVLVSASPVAQAQFSQTNTPSAVSSINCAEFAEHPTPNDLAQEIAQIEVERVLSGVRYFEEHPVFEYLQTKQLDLEACFAQLQPNDDQNLIAATIVNAMESKIAELEVQYASDQALYNDNHPIQQSRRLELEALHQHLTNLM